LSERLQIQRYNKSTADPLVSNQSKLLDKNRKPLVSQPPLIQTKLAINQPGDEYEQEADRVAEQVMRMPDPVIQRKCAKCDEDEKKILQAKEASGQVSENQNQDVPPIVHEVMRSPGKPLDSSTRAFMEPRIGHDFSKVRVHADTRAAESAQAVNAMAYTVGSDVVFGAGQYTPWSDIGRRLMAHELTHVMQQSGSDGIHLDQSSYERDLTSITTSLKLQRQQSYPAICKYMPSKDMSPREWIRCRDSGGIQENNEYPLRFSENGVVATKDKLIAWMTRKGMTEKVAITNIMSSHEFAGTDKAREEAKAQLISAIPREKLSVCIRPVQIADDNGKKPTILPSLAEAKATWGKCCIDLSVKEPKTVSRTAFKTLDFGGSNTTPEMNNLFYAAGEAGGCISLFIVEYFQQGNLINKDIAGGAATYGTPGGDSIFAVEGLDPSIVAHELGHAMGLGEWAHSLAGTVMGVTAAKHNQKESDKVTEVICDKVRTSASSKPSGKKDCYFSIK
jgi:hypothetical protein